MSTEAAIKRDDDPDVEEFELVLDGDWSDEEAAELEALAGVLPLDDDDHLVAFAQIHDLIVQARRGREEQQPLIDLRAGMEDTEFSNEPLQDGTAGEAEFLQALAAYGHCYLRAARQVAAYERLRLRIAAAQGIRAKLEAAGRVEDARKVGKHVEAAKVRLRERVSERQYDAEIAGHEKRVQMLADRLEARSGEDPERGAAVAKVRKAERALERAEAQQAHDRAEAVDHGGGRRWPRRRGRA